MSDSDSGLTIRAMAERTGVAQGTLRMWETRYEFPVPQRLPSGHRRYSENQVDQVLQIARDREAGLTMKAAIERARRAARPAEDSIFAGLRRRRPDLSPTRFRSVPDRPLTRDRGRVRRARRAPGAVRLLPA